MSARSEQLERALELYLGWREAGGGDAAALLAAHPDLTEFLQPLLAPEPAAAPRELGPFRILRELGRGGMGIVFEAVQRSLGRRVALKLLPAPLALRPEMLARFHREARTLGRLSHPGIVSILEVGGEAEQPWIAMEFVEGAPLDQVIDELRRAGAAADAPGAFARAVAARLRRAEGAPQATAPVGSSAGRIAAAVDLAIQIADALAHAHDAGIVHRDVKPSNLLVTADGAAVLTDFGIAREHGAPGLTLSGALTGTPRYLAPEQARGERDSIDARSDLFALGATLYELLTLAPAFPGAHAHAVVERILHDDPIDPRRHARAIRADLAAIVLKSLEKEPRRRYGDARALAADLRAYRDGRPVAARPIGAWSRAARWIRREPYRAAALGLLLLAVPALSAFAAYTVARAPMVAAGERTQRERAVEHALAEGFLQLGDLRNDRARAAFDRALALAPQSDEAFAGGVLACLEGKELDAAAARLAAAGARDLRLVRFLDARLRRLRGDRASAEAIERELGAPRGRVELFLTGVAMRRRAIGVRASDAASYAKLTRDAFELLDRSVLQSPSPRLAYHVERALAAGELPIETAARAGAEALAALWPDSAAAQYAIGTSLHLLGANDLPACIAALRRSVELAPEFARGHYALGSMLQANGNAADAIAPLQRCLELEPDVPDAMGSLGKALAQVGRRDEGIALLERALAREPRHRLNWFNLGVLQHRAGSLDEALVAYEKAYAIDPAAADLNAVSLHRNWMLILLPRDAARAREVGERAARITARRNPYVLGLLAEANWRCGDRDLALALVDESESVVDPRDPQAAAHRQALARWRVEWGAAGR